MNLLIVCISRAWGGLEQVAVKDALDLVACGHRVRFVYLDQTPSQQALEKCMDPKLEKLPLLRMPRGYLDFSVGLWLRKARKDGFQIVHIHQTTLLGTIIPWIQFIPSLRKWVVIASRHILNNHQKKTFYHRWIYKRLDRMLVMSESLRANVLATHSLSPKKVEVVCLGLSDSFFAPNEAARQKYRYEWQVEPEEIVIGMVGRIDPNKGQDTLIRALRLIRNAKLPVRRVRAVIVGEETRDRPPGYCEELKKLALELSVQDLLFFTGFVENVPDAIQAFDLAVMPSLEEAFGLAAIEAMAAGKPTVISAAGSYVEIVGPAEEYGLSFEPRDSKGLAFQILRLLENRIWSQELGDRGKASIRDRYYWKTRLDRTLDIYNVCIRERQKPN